MMVQDVDSVLSELIHDTPPHFTGTLILSMTSANMKLMRDIVPSKLPATIRRPTNKTEVTALE
jgi:hypothetical protein